MPTTLQRPVGLIVMCLLSLAIGVIGGLGAWLFRVLIGVLHNLFFLGELSFSYDANTHTSTNPWGAGIIIVPVIGALLVAWLVKTFAPEAKGHGVPEVIDAIHYKRGIIRPIVAVIKSLASAICIGSGGSVGREGPIIQIGSAFGATLGEILNVPARQQVTLVAAGAAAGIAATFNAPLGGVVFAIELLLISINVRTLLPVAIATITSTYIGRALLGVYPAFNIQPLQVNQFELNSPWLLLLLVPFGILMGLASVVFIKGIYWTEDQFEKMPGGDLVRHSTGMLVCGILFYVMWRTTGRYYLEGIGYASIVDILSRELTNPWFLLLICALKLLVTSLTLGSGGSGGVFSPALYMGATLGAAYAHFANQFIPGLHVDPVTFALAGMAAGVGASTGAMITAAVMLQEMTADNNVMMPIIVTTIIACAVRKYLSPASIYTLKLLRRGRIVPEGLQAALDDARHVEDVMGQDFRIVAEDSAIEPYAGLTIVAHEGRVVRVFHPYSTVGLDSQSPPDDGDAFLLFPTRTPLVDAMREMQLADANCAVVLSVPGSDQIEDVIGVITWHELGVYRTRWSELL